MTYRTRGGGEVVRTCWCPGTITRMSDAGSRDGRRKLGLGWAFVEYDDGESSWLLASRPTFFNANKAGARRFKPDDAAGDDADGGDAADDEDLSDADIVPADSSSSDGEFGDDDDDS